MRSHPPRAAFYFVVLATLLLLSPTTSRAAESPDNSAAMAEFEQFVEERIETDQLPGLAIALMKDDFTWSKAFGYCDVENQSPMVVESAFRLASVTKPMTAVAILKLVEQGKIDLDAPIQTYVPYFPEKPWPITVRQLLGHLGGISHYRNPDVESHIKDQLDTRQAIAIFEEFDLVAEPGSRFNYSSYGYNLLGAAIEGASGQSYGEFMHENIWGPLGMDDTRMDHPDELIPHRVRGYRLVDGKLQNDEFVNISSRFAAGGTRSTVLDLLKFVRGIGDAKILSPETTDQMFTSLATRDGRDTGYGLGWNPSDINGRFIVAHNGGQPETSTLLMFVPSANYAVAVACNMRGADLSVFASRLHLLLFDEAFDSRAYVPETHDRVVYEAVNAAFEQGMGQIDRYGKPLTTDTDELTEAFRFFNDVTNQATIANDVETAQQRVRDARHPVGGRQLARLGSFMADRLLEAEPNKKDAYHHDGPFAFFADYCDLCQQSADVPEAFRLRPQLQEKVASWNEDWKRVWTDETKRLAITAASDVEDVERTLGPLFEGASIRPAFVDDLVGAARNSFYLGDAAKGFRWAKLAAELYPDSAVTNVTMGAVLVFAGQRDQARAALQKAADLDSAGAGGASYMQRMGTDIAGLGQIAPAIAFTELAAGVHPDDAGLRTALGALYEQANEPDKAAAAYEEALAIDAELETAQQALKRLREAEEGGSEE